MPKTSRSTSRIFAVLAAVGLLAAACGSDETADDSAAEVVAPDTTAASEETVAETTTTAPAVTEPAIEEVACVDTDLGINDYTMDVAGTIYSVRAYVPATIADGEPLPVVLNWHGLGSDGPQQALFTGYETLAEAEGFIVVSPTGPPAPGDTRNSWELIQLDTPDRDDVAFASALIDDVIEQFCGDEQRVYSTGMSNGGLFTSRLVCDLSDRIAAAASVAGVTHPDECTPARAVPFIAFHGTADAVVPFDGTTGSSSLLEADAEQGVIDFFSQIMPDEFAEFAADASCSADPEIREVSAEVKAFDYVGCDGDAPMTFYEIAEGGHTWPNSPFAAVLEASGLGYTTLDVDATVDAWAFFQEHTLNS